jgi:hypothetical protein
MGLIAPLINGNYFAFADIEFRADGLLFAGCTTINYSDNLDRAKVRGTASVPLGLTKGRYEAKGDVEMYLDSFSTLIAALGGGVAWRQVPLAVSITYGPNLGMNLPLVTDIIEGFYIGEVTAGNSEGDGPLTRKFTMHIPGQILWNGLPSIIETSTLQAVA